MNPKEITKRYYELEKNVIQKKRTCMFPLCGKTAIGSHTISEAVLRNIGTKGHVRMFKVHPYKGFDLPSIGIGQATRVSAFCAKHDSELFQPIDNVHLDLSNIRNILLLNYRAIIQEHILKLNKQEVYAIALNLFKNYDITTFEYYNRRANEIPLNLKVTEWYADSILRCYHSNYNDYAFETIQLPFFEITASELIGWEPFDISQIKRRICKTYGYFDPFSFLFVHIYPDPQKKFLTLVLSMHRRDLEILNWYHHFILQLEPEKALSDFLLLYLELWCCSEDFYQRFIHPKKNDIKSIFSSTMIQNMMIRETNIHLFNV